MSDTGTAARTAEEEHEGHDLRRSLGFRDLVVYGLLFVASMAPVGVFGTLDAKSHGAVALVYVGARCSPTRAWRSARSPVSSRAGWRSLTTC